MINWKKGEERRKRGEERRREEKKSKRVNCRRVYMIFCIRAILMYSTKKTRKVRK
jgi:hypothetical protein